MARAFSSILPVCLLYNSMLPYCSTSHAVSRHTGMLKSWWQTAGLRVVIVHVCFVRTHRCTVHSQPHFQAYICAQAHQAVCQRARTLNWTVQQPRRRTPFSRKLPRGRNRSLKCRCSSTFTGPTGFGSETGRMYLNYDYLCDEQYRACLIVE